MNCILLPEVDSTNSYLIRLLEQNCDFAEGTVFYATRQTAGKGQPGNRWESEPGKNLTFSILLKPTFLPARRQFILSEVASLAIVDTLNGYLPGFCIKWPNDIYHSDRKVVGMLVENRLAGHNVMHSVIGAGINLNQTEFKSDAPNPVSVKTLLHEQGTERSLSIESVLNEVVKKLMEYYGEVKQGGADRIHRRYLEHLYRREGLHLYTDADTQERFLAAIDDVEPEGPLRLRTENGEVRRYMFKEVKFHLPCGIVKE